MGDDGTFLMLDNYYRYCNCESKGGCPIREIDYKPVIKRNAPCFAPIKPDGTRYVIRDINKFITVLLRKTYDILVKNGKFNTEREDDYAVENAVRYIFENEYRGRNYYVGKNSGPNGINLTINKSNETLLLAQRIELPVLITEVMEKYRKDYMIRDEVLSKLHNVRAVAKMAARKNENAAVKRRENLRKLQELQDTLVKDSRVDVPTAYFKEAKDEHARLKRHIASNYSTYDSRISEFIYLMTEQEILGFYEFNNEERLHYPKENPLKRTFISLLNYIIQVVIPRVNRWKFIEDYMVSQFYKPSIEAAIAAYDDYMKAKSAEPAGGAGGPSSYSGVYPSSSSSSSSGLKSAFRTPAAPASPPVPIEAAAGSPSSSSSSSAVAVPPIATEREKFIGSATTAAAFAFAAADPGNEEQYAKALQALNNAKEIAGSRFDAGERTPVPKGPSDTNSTSELGGGGKRRSTKRRSTKRRSTKRRSTKRRSTKRNKKHGKTHRRR